MQSIMTRFRAIFLAAGRRTPRRPLVYPAHHGAQSTGDEMSASETRTAASQALAAESALKDIVTDLRILTHEPEMDRYLERRNPETLRNLELTFLNFAIHKKRYDQARLLDPQGMEIVRVNYHRRGSRRHRPARSVTAQGRPLLFQGNHWSGAGTDFYLAAGPEHRAGRH